MSHRHQHHPPEAPGASEEPRDVLAAEQFPGPSPDAAIHIGPVELPDDPAGESEPHDVLAAEEFAMPAPRHGGASAEVAAPAERPSRARLLTGMLAAGLAAVVVVLRRLRRS